MIRTPLGEADPLALRAFRDAMRDILEAEGSVELLLDPDALEDLWVSDRGGRSAARGRA